MQGNESVGSAAKLLKVNSMDVRADAVRAIKFKNKKLKLITKKVADLDEGNDNGDTRFHKILQSKNESDTRSKKEIVVTCYHNGKITLSIKNKSEETELHKAVGRRKRADVDALLRSGANIDESDENGNSTAHFFIEDERTKFDIAMGSCRDSVPWHRDNLENESVNYVEWLIAKGFDFNRRNKEGKSALRLSIEYNLHHISLALLKYTQDTHSFEKHDQTLLHLFFECNAKQKRKHRCNSTLRYNWYLFNLRYATKIVQLLLDKGCSAMALGNKSRTLLRMAIEVEEEIGVIEMLINNALKARDLATTVLLELSKSCGSWSDSRVKYFLYVLRVLMARGVDVNCQDGNGMTPLHHAFLGNNLRVVDLLNDHRADFGVTTNDGDNLFHTLAKRDHRQGESNVEALFDLLAKKGSCDAHAANNFHETPLLIACQHENLAIVRKLIEHGVDVNFANQLGQTPLHLAAYYNCEESVVEVLLDNGADVNAKDIEADRPLFYAKSSLVPLLLRRGSHVDAGTFASIVDIGFLRDATHMLRYGADVNLLIDSIPQSRLLRAPYTRLNFLMAHWIKLRAAKLPCSRKFESLAEDDNCQRFYRECLEEIEAMKSTIIDGRATTSMYDFLRMDFRGRRVHVNDEKFLSIIDFSSLEKQFPNYTTLILASYHETVMWKSLLEPAKRAWIKLTNFSWPDLCSEGIFAYLGNGDLVNVIEHEDRHVPIKGVQ